LNDLVDDLLEDITLEYHISISCTSAGQPGCPA